jgi:hypothetical protein
MDPDKRLKEAVEEARDVLGRYIPPGARDCGEAINEIMEALDNREVDQALAESEAKEKGDNWVPTNRRATATGSAP